MLRRSKRNQPAAVVGSEGFAQLYERTSTTIFSYFMRRLFEPEIALDLTAEVYAQALLARRRFRGTTAEEATHWLYGIARNQLLTYIRRGSTELKAVARLGIELPTIDAEDYERALDIADASALRSSLGEALSELSPEQQQAVWLRVVEELEYAEVADRLAISADAARARVHRGLRALAGHFTQATELEDLAHEGS
jgi:RNA polymerase sigma-70 factor (ECF subfamily)